MNQVLNVKSFNDSVTPNESNYGPIYGIFDLEDSPISVKSKIPRVLCERHERVTKLKIKMNLSRTSFILATDRSKNDLVDSLCSISGRCFSIGFDTAPPIDNERRFEAVHHQTGVAIEVQILDSPSKTHVVIEVTRKYGSNSIFLCLFDQLIKTMDDGKL